MVWLVVQGGSILCENAGGESTALFEDVGHSEDAERIMQELYIGDLCE